MEREHEQSELIDLGTVSVETQGPVAEHIEFGVIGRPLGISDGE